MKFMKKLFLFILVMIGCMGMEAQSRYTISGNVVGLEDGELSLVVLESEMLKILNRAQVANGKFLFSGEVDSVVLVGILTSKKELVAELMLENADFGVLSGGVVTGGGNAQKLLEKFNALNVELAVERQKLEDEYQMAEQKKNKREMAAIDARYQEFLVNVQERESELLRKNADTYVAAYVVASTMKDIFLSSISTLVIQSHSAFVVAYSFTPSLGFIILYSVLLFPPMKGTSKDCVCTCISGAVYFFCLTVTFTDSAPLYDRMILPVLSESDRFSPTVNEIFSSSMRMAEIQSTSLLAFSSPLSSGFFIWYNMDFVPPLHPISINCGAEITGVSEYSYCFIFRLTGSAP